MRNSAIAFTLAMPNLEAPLRWCTSSAATPFTKRVNQRGRRVTLCKLPVYAQRRGATLGAMAVAAINCGNHAGTLNFETFVAIYTCVFESVGQPEGDNRAKEAPRSNRMINRMTHTKTNKLR